MKRLLTLFVLILLSAVSYASIITDKEIDLLVKELNARRPENIRFSKFQRTIIFDVYNANADEVEKMTPNKLAKSFNDEVASRNASNFISVRAIYHYRNDIGKQLTKVVEASPFDFLGITEEEYYISLKDNPRALDVNIELSVPRGWHCSSSRGPHTVVHYSVANGENQVAFMLQVFPLPLFLSRKETREIFYGSEEYGLTKEDLLEGIEGEIVEVKEDVVGLYPALHFKLLQKIMILGEKHSLYTNLWYVIYEDRAIMIWGTVMHPEKWEKKLYDTMFHVMVSQIRFPDHFEKQYE